jgi:hypothetical protein
MGINVVLKDESIANKPPVLHLRRDGSDVDLLADETLLGWFNSDGEFILACPSEEEVNKLKNDGFSFDEDGQLKVTK